MPNFTAGTSFTDGVTNDVTAAKLNALIADAVPTSSLSLNSTTGTISQFSSGTGTAASPAIQPTGDTNTGIFFPAADTIAFSEGGAESMRIDSSGRVGIGDTNPIVKLQIRNDGITGANNYLQLITSSDSGKGVWQGIDVTNRLFYFKKNDSNDYAYDWQRADGTSYLRIDSSGNVLIGTTSASSGASGRGLLEVNGSTDSLIALRRGGTLGLHLYTSSAEGRVSQAENLPLTLHTSNTERLRITSGGEVCVGRTSSGAKLHIYNSGSTDARTAYFEKATGATDGYYLVCYAGGTSHFLILGNGNCQNANNSYSGISDIKLKQDITDASSQWSDIKNLRVRKYRFKEYPEMPLQIGLVAQEVELVSPQLVEETKDTDREGNDLGTITKGVKYSVLYMKAVKALQEAMDRIEQLESKVAALEAA